jgi:protein-tyrosine phosphatase
VIDLHTHVLPGIDDGPPSVEESLALARSAAAQGTTTLVATPHIAWDLPNTAQTVADGVAALKPRLAEAGVPVELRTGGEVVITWAAELSDDDLSALHLGGGEWLLAECPLSPSAMGFDTLLYSLQERGHRIVLAHPERSPALQRHPELLERFVADGMLSSITAGSLRGDFGSTVRRFTIDLVERDLVHNVASDTHDARHRRPGIADAFEVAEEDLPGISERAQWLTVDVPRAILDGGPVPAPPGAPPRRRKRGLLRRVARSR